ncbi:hypothetical protein MSG28_012591 [Choristoneura fumiferana]|uniref:Uncharacterized protein n=1 Tax=Choristoneura fumiferana TaxID=7141 RepID=A0ACC0JH43_CHOFU|nr:hypothetical protein MSG28_012591 [Choristoneura fumiferana]
MTHLVSRYLFVKLMRGASTSSHTVKLSISELFSSNLPKVKCHNSRQIVYVSIDSRAYETKKYNYGSCDLANLRVFPVDVEENQRDQVKVEVARDVPSCWVTLEVKSRFKIASKLYSTATTITGMVSENVKVFTHLYVSEAVLTPQFRVFGEPGRPQALIVVAEVVTIAEEAILYIYRTIHYPPPVDPFSNTTATTQNQCVCDPTCIAPCARARPQSLATLKMWWYLAVICLVNVAAGQNTTGNDGGTELDYYSMPALSELDDFDLCMRDPGAVYCILHRGVCANQHCGLNLTHADAGESTAAAMHSCLNVESLSVRYCKTQADQLPYDALDWSVGAIILAILLINIGCSAE